MISYQSFEGVGGGVSLSPTRAPAVFTPMKKYSYLYQLYMQSEAWKELRQKIIELDGHSCRKCGASATLEVHHKTYARLGNEDLDDLVTLCARCHGRADKKRKRKAAYKERNRRQFGFI